MEAFGTGDGEVGRDDDNDDDDVVDSTVHKLFGINQELDLI